MGFGGFLKKTGQILAKGGAVLTTSQGLQPVVDPLLRGVLPQGSQGTLTTVENDLTKIGGLVTTTEGIMASLGTGVTGADKLKAVTPLVRGVVLQSELVSGKKVKNNELFTDATTRLTAAIADILSSLEEPAVTK